MRDRPDRLGEVLLEALAVIHLNAGVHLDERVAANAMENFRAWIDGLPPEERTLLKEMAERRARDEPDPRRAAFFREVPTFFLL